MKNDKQPHVRVTDYEVVAGEILLVLDAYRVPAYLVDDVFAEVKEQIDLLPVTISATGLPKAEADRRKADMRRNFGLLKNRRLKWPAVQPPAPRAAIAAVAEKVRTETFALQVEASAQAE